MNQYPIIADYIKGCLS
jgi:hypothetical protein